MKYLNLETTGEKIKFWLVTYPIAVIVGMFFLFLYVIGRLEIKHWERIPEWPEKLIIYSNHKSFVWEPIILVAIFIKHYLRHPRRFFPWSVPDKKNFYSLRYPGKLLPLSDPQVKNFYRSLLFWPIKDRFVYVERGESEGRAFKPLVRIVNDGGIVVIFPEGGRTSTEKDINKHVFSKTGFDIRKFKAGIGHLVNRTNAPAIPIVVEGCDKVLPNDGSFIPRIWHKVTITIGYPIRFNPELKKYPEMAGKNKHILVTDYLQNKMLELADEKARKTA